MVAEVLKLLSGRMTILIGAIAGFSVFLLIQIFRKTRLRFISFSFLFFFSLALINFMFFFDHRQEDQIVGAWFIWFLLSVNCYSWVMDEFVNRFIPVTQRYSFFSKVYLSSELAAIVPACVVAFTEYEWHFRKVALLAGFGFFLLMSMILVFMIYPRVYEIRVSRNQLTEKLPHKALLSMRRVIQWIFIFGTGVGIVRFLSNHMFNTILRNDLYFFEQRQDYYGYSILATSLLTVIFSVFLQRRIQDKKVSPFRVFYLFIAVAILGGLMCFARFEPFLFLIFVSLTRGALKGLYSPALNSIFSGFSHAVRNRFQAIHSLAFLGISGMLFTLAYFLESIFVGTRLLIQGVVFISFSVMIFYFSKRLRVELVRNYYRMLFYGTQSAKVYSALLLSYIRPKGYRKQMLNLLASEPESVILKKIIFEGLGLVWDPSLLAVYEKILRTHPMPGRLDPSVPAGKTPYRGLEELQIVAIRVLARSGDIKAQQLLLQTFRNPDLTFSFRVRREAALRLKKIAREDAMRFFLAGLKSDNERIVADCIEILGVFQDESLVPVFRDLMKSPYIRIRYNALKELYSFRSERNYVQKFLVQGLQSQDLVEARAALYVIGALGDQALKFDLPQSVRAEQSLNHLIYLSWSYRSLKKHEFFNAWIKLIPQLLQGPEIVVFFHLFSQLSHKERFSFLERMAHQMLTEEDRVIFERLREALRDSSFDFHEEADFMESVFKPVSFLLLGQV